MLCSSPRCSAISSSSFHSLSGFMSMLLVMNSNNFVRNFWMHLRDQHLLPLVHVVQADQVPPVHHRDNMVALQLFARWNLYHVHVIAIRLISSSHFGHWGCPLELSSSYDHTQVYPQSAHSQSRP